MVGRNTRSSFRETTMSALSTSLSRLLHSWTEGSCAAGPVLRAGWGALLRLALDPTLHTVVLHGRRKPARFPVRRRAAGGRCFGDTWATPGHPRSGWKTPHAGSGSLAQAVKRRRVRHHVFGHLHAAGGHRMRQGETVFYNVAACDEQYRIVNQARVFEVEAAP